MGLEPTIPPVTASPGICILWMLENWNHEVPWNCFLECVPKPYQKPTELYFQGPESVPDIPSHFHT